MHESIRKLADYVMEDVEKARSGDYDAEKRVGLGVLGELRVHKLLARFEC